MLIAGLDEPDTQRALLAGQAVHFVKVGGEAVFTGTLTLRNGGISGENFLRCRLQNPYLPCIEESCWDVIGALEVQEQVKTPYYLYPIMTSNDAPEVLGDFYTSGFFS